jgi:type II secretory pathway pseudopilin PulG
MRASFPVRSFSLVEVVIALAVFALSISVILALLLPLSRLGAQSADRLVAQRLADALQAELARLAAAETFDALALEVPLLMTPGSGLAFVATRDGSQLHSRHYLPPASARIAAAEQYFLLECWRFPEAPLRFEAGQSVLALAVRVSWPAGESVAPADQETLFTVTISR